MPAARALGLEPRAEALGVRGARWRRRGAGRRRAAAGGGGRGASSQSEAQITAQPAGSSAGSPVCSVPPPPPRRRRPAAATARRLAAPSSPSRPTPTHSQAPLSSPPLAFLSLSPPPKPRAKRAKGREASASGLTRDLGAPRRGERGRAGRGLWERRGELEGAPGAGPGSWTNFRARVFPHQSLGARGEHQRASLLRLERGAGFGESTHTAFSPISGPARRGNGAHHTQRADGETEAQGGYNGLSKIPRLVCNVRIKPSKVVPLDSKCASQTGLLLTTLHLFESWGPLIPCGEASRIGLKR